MRIDVQFELEFAWVLVLDALKVRNRLANHAQIQVESNASDVSRLLTAEQVAGPSNFKILQSHLHSRAEFVVGSNRGKAIVRQVGQRFGWVIEEVGISTFATATHATTNLVQLAEPETLGAINNQGICIGDINSTFGLVDGFDSVVNEENLTLTNEFSPDCSSHLLFAVSTDVSQNRVPIFGRCGQGRHFTNASYGHFEGSRNRRCRHGKHIDVLLEIFQLFFVLDAKALFFVNDDETEVSKLDSPAEQTVCADNQIDSTRCQPLDCLF